MELLDVSSSLPGLKFKPGLTSWTPCSKDLVGYERYEDVPEQWRTQVRPSMFPPSKHDAAKYNLERCIRILPHMQNTGGFFVAVLHKLKPLPWEARPKVSLSVAESPANENGEDVSQSVAERSGDNKRSVEDITEIQEVKPPKSPQRKKRRIQGYKEDPFVFFKEDDELWPILQKCYDLRPDLSCTSFLTRSFVGQKKNIYFTTQALRSLIINNDERLKVRCFIPSLTMPPKLMLLR